MPIIVFALVLLELPVDFMRPMRIQRPQRGGSEKFDFDDDKSNLCTLGCCLIPHKDLK